MSRRSSAGLKEPHEAVQCGFCRKFLEFSGSREFVCAFCGRVNRKLEDRMCETSEVFEVQLVRTGPCMFKEGQGLAEKVFPIDLMSCALCMDEMGDCVFLSCGHGGFCESCAKSVIINFKQCSVCRSEISKVVRVIALAPSTATALEVCVKAESCVRLPRVPSAKSKK
jgi:LSD1 subclass zinc finger protein